MKSLQPFFLNNVKVVYEDEAIIVVDKPAGVLSHPNEPSENRHSVMPLNYDSEGEFFELPGFRLYLLHRLDKETSGCLLFAKNQSIAKQLKLKFAEHSIHKIYTALVVGIQRQKTTWKDHLSKTKGKVRYTDSKDANAETDVVPIQTFPKNKLTLLELLPKSGKTHQLRIQSSKRNLHIVGDRQYGNFKKNKDLKTQFDIKRMFLHAQKLQFNMPNSKETLLIESPLPEDFHNIIDKIRDSEAI